MRQAKTHFADMYFITIENINRYFKRCTWKEDMKMGIVWNLLFKVHNLQHEQHHCMAKLLH